MIEEWINEIKRENALEMLGMVLVHNGIVRATSKDGRKVKGVKVSFDKNILQPLVERLRHRDGIADIKVWINEGELQVGDDIMYLVVAGRFREDVFPVMQELLTKVKTEVVKKEEFWLDG